MITKNAATDHPILKLLAERWSPYGFDDRPVPEAVMEATARGFSNLKVEPCLTLAGRILRSLILMFSGFGRVNTPWKDLPPRSDTRKPTGRGNPFCRHVGGE